MKEKDKIAHIMECTVEDIETVKGKVLYISDEHKSKKECTLCPPGASFSNITPSGTERIDSNGIDQMFSSIQLLPKALSSSRTAESKGEAVVFLQVFLLLRWFQEMVTKP